jgi:hypothetical protein
MNGSGGGEQGGKGREKGQKAKVITIVNESHHKDKVE